MRGGVGGGAAGPTHEATAVEQQRAWSARSISFSMRRASMSRLNIISTERISCRVSVPDLSSSRRRKPRRTCEGRGRRGSGERCRAVVVRGGPEQAGVEAEGPRRTSLKRVEKCSRILPCAFRGKEEGR